VSRQQAEEVTQQPLHKGHDTVTAAALLALTLAGKDGPSDCLPSAA
jgi:hypothetical protein